MNVLFLVNELLPVCGVTKHFFHLMTGLRSYYPKNDYFIICGGGDVVTKFIDIGCQVYIDKNIKHEMRSISGYLKSIYTVTKFVKENRIDIVHSHHHYAASIASQVSKITRVKTILTNHGILPEVGILNHFTAKHIIVVNEYAKEYIIKNKFKKAEEVSVIYHGFPILDFTKTKNTKLRVISGGRFVKEKGFNVYIKAVSVLSKDVKSKSEFLIAGTGVEEKNLRVLNEKLEAGIEFLGQIDDFPELLKTTDVFVFHSEAEGFPTVLIEAGLTSNLVVSTFFYGHSSILNKENSILYNPWDADQLAEILNGVILNYESKQNIIMNFHEDIKEKFSLAKMVEDTIRIYNFILK